MSVVGRLARAVPGAYRLRYWRALTGSRRVLPKTTHPPEVTFVVADANRGWILDRIAREIAVRCRSPASVVYQQEWRRRRGEIAFFTHWRLFLDDLASGANGLSFVYLTHLPTGVDLAELMFGLRYVAGVVCMNSTNGALIAAAGLDSRRILVAPGAADPDRFHPLETRHPVGVLLSAAFYRRKAPDKLLSVVDACPELPFLLIGPGWDRWERFAALKSRVNFRHVESEYQSYPDLYRTCDRFLSLSTLEGGPIPLLEAMMCGLVPVASRTGFVADVVQHGANGFVFESTESAASVAALLRGAQHVPGDVRASVLPYSWECFGRRVSAFVEALIDDARAAV